MIRIYGASDDLIEIEGDISEEFPYYDADDTLLAFSDGTVLRVAFDHDGIWRFTPLTHGKARLVHTICVPDGVDDEYSDQVHLFDEALPETEQIKWAVLGTHLERRRR